PPAAETPAAQRPEAEAPAAEADESDAQRVDPVTRRNILPRSPFVLAQYAGGEEDEAQGAAAAAAGAEAPPINITVTPDGRIVISSADVAALDEMQDLLSELGPPNR
ncbi:MAG TPA: hypothetical protein PKC18_05040, partial [Lacipirellulaceae bacterium]|nr:hypothetical protein [Lacipirellulaceae bacterium]